MNKNFDFQDLSDYLNIDIYDLIDAIAQLDKEDISGLFEWVKEQYNERKHYEKGYKPGLILNPKTNRFIKVGGFTHRKMCNRDRANYNLDEHNRFPDHSLFGWRQQ